MKWTDIKKVKWHLENGDGFRLGDGSGKLNDNLPKYVTFQGRDYLGYDSFNLTKPIIEELLKHELTKKDRKNLMILNR